MKLTVLLFGAMRDAAGSGRLDLDFEDSISIAALWDSLRTDFPALGATGADRLTAVNQDFAAEDRVLRDGDEVAFFPPVSGG